MKSTKEILSLILSGFLLVSIAGCNGENKKNVADAVLYEEGMDYVISEKATPKQYYALSYEYLGGDEVMPIGGFYGPCTSGGSVDGNEFKNLLTDYVYGKLAEAGINMIVCSGDVWMNEGNNNTAHLMLDLAEKYGIGYFFNVQYVQEQLGNKTAPYPTENMELNTAEGKAKLQSIIAEMTKNGERKNILGLHAKDEPFTHEIRNIGVLKKAFDEIENASGMDLYGNALDWWENTWNFWGYCDSITYDEYLVDYIETFQPKMLSATMYPYTSANTKDSSLTTILYNRLAIYREYSIKYNIPFWRMMQAGGQWNDAQAWIDSVDPYPSEGELLLDVNMSLAYGAKAIQYFPVIQPLWFAYQTGNTYDFENRNGLIGANANLTRWFYFAKRANEQVKAVDEYLMKAANEGVIVYGENATEVIVTNGRDNETVIESGKYRELTSINGDDCVIGCFDYKGGTALYVVNFSRTDKCDVILKFDNKYRYKVIQRAQECDVVGTSIPLTLDAGEGALITLY